MGPLIWPGFRPDTFPTLYVIANRETVLVQWRHEWPAGFTGAAAKGEFMKVGQSVEVRALRLAARNVSLEASRARVTRSATGLVVLLLNVR